MRLELVGSVGPTDRVLRTTGIPLSTVAWVKVAFGSAIPDIWVSLKIRFPQKTIFDLTSAFSNSGNILFLNSTVDGTMSWVYLKNLGDGVNMYWTLNDADSLVELAPWAEIAQADKWNLIELHYSEGAYHDLYINGVYAARQDLTVYVGSPDAVFIGQDLSTTLYNPCNFYFDDVKIGTTRGASDLFADNFDGPDLSSWSEFHGCISHIVNPFPDPDA